jgi:TonB family protein
VLPVLSGLKGLPPGEVVFVEVRIDAEGAVTDSCLVRGVRADIDRRALDAVRLWRFEPPRVNAATETAAGRLEAGTPVPIFMTVAVELER